MRAEDVLFPEVYEQNKKNLAGLKQELKKDLWVMCLGAGVSISAGLPNWYRLLAKITAQLIPLEFSNAFKFKIDQNDLNLAYLKGVCRFKENLVWDEEFVKKMENALSGDYWETFSKINVLEAAEYIRNFIADGADFSGKGEDRQKENINWYMNYFIQEACHVNVSINNLEDKTLGAVARLMTDNAVPVYNVITYNYDNLLETYLRDVEKCRPEKVHSITKKDDLRDFEVHQSEKDTTDDWNIYHVHGRIPVIQYPGEEQSESVVLTESDYYQEERINYSWVNIVQSYAIARANLIFVGFSGADYNFRRIIKYVNQDKMKAHKRYIFFAIDDVVNAVLCNEKDMDTCIEKMRDSATGEYAFEKLLINHLIHAQTLYWKKHGLNVIWTSISELAGDLDSLHDSLV